MRHIFLIAVFAVLLVVGCVDQYTQPPKFAIGDTVALKPTNTKAIVIRINPFDNSYWVRYADSEGELHEMSVEEFAIEGKVEPAPR